MQKVQRWSQPFCTCTKARVRPRMPSIRCGAVSLHRHDVVDRGFSRSPPTPKSAAPGLGRHLLVVADDAARPRHGGEALGLDLRGAAGDDDAPRPGFSRARRRIDWRAWRVASAGDRAGVDDDDVRVARPPPRGAASPRIRQVLSRQPKVTISTAHHAAPAKSAGAKHALAFELDRPGHQHVVVVRATRWRDRRRAA